MTLRRELSLVHATALNMIDMVGIGPFITTALVASTMGFGPYAILAWIGGALLAFTDAAIWSELGAKMPNAGGTYAFVKESYGGKGLGRMMAFLFVWQTTFQAPLVITSAALGFSKYFGYVAPTTALESKLISVGVIVLVVFLLYRRIADVGKISVVLWVTVVGCLLAIIGLGFWNADPLVMSQFMGAGGTPWPEFKFDHLGAAMILTVYSYLGYYNICHLGSEAKNPQRTIPRSMYISVAGIALLYLLMQASIFSVLPFEAVARSPYVISTFFETLYGSTAAIIATCFVLVIALSSLFALMLGYSRIPYAAAKDKLFFPVFGREHPKHQFPHIALLVLGAIGILFTLTITLDDTIKAIITMRVFTQFLSQTLGLVLLRRRVGAAAMPWKMWLYPIPVILVTIGWLSIFASAKWEQQLAGVVAPLIGAIVYVFVVKRYSENQESKVA
ncbi:MAG: amino acid permease [Ignavibacteria bacterium]|nr:amino acid permease [Ignavibacteria bacterium]